MNLNQTFKKNLFFWTKHCCINALPSFIIALLLFRDTDKLKLIISMLFAIGTFVLIYTLLTYNFNKFRDPENLLYKALQKSLKVRLNISILSIFILIISGLIGAPLFPIIPDFYAGLLASFILNPFFPFMRGETMMILGDAPFLATYALTLAEGFILSFFLFLTVILILIIFKFKSRKKASA